MRLWRFLAMIVACGWHASLATAQDNGTDAPFDSSVAATTLETYDFYAPLWNVRAGAIFLNRSNPSSAEIATYNSLPFIDAAQIGLNWGTGYELSATRSAGDAFCEIRFFSVDEIQGSTTNVSPVGGIIEIGGQFYFGVPSTLFQTNYASTFLSAEVNCGTQVGPNLAVVFGFRYIQLDEQLITYYDIVSPESVSTIVNNDLFGLQLGAIGTLFQSGNLRADFYLKAGVYHNESERTQANNFLTTNVDGSNATFVGDIGLTLTYQLTPRLAITGGYQLMWLNSFLWLDGVATASDESEFPPVAVGAQDCLFYQGATAAITFTW